MAQRAPIDDQCSDKMPGPTTKTSYYGKISEYSCSAMVDATVEEVRQAALSWAADLGWFRDKDLDQVMVFNITRFSRLLGNLQMLVFAEKQDRGTWLSFTASQSVTLPGQVDDLPRAVQQFARGVCSALSESGSTIDASWYGSGLTSDARKRLKNLERFRLAAQRTWTALLLPALALAWFLPDFPDPTDREGFFLIVAVWLFTVSAFFPYLRYRVVGQRYKSLLVILSFTAAFMAAITVVAVLFLTDRLS